MNGKKASLFVAAAAALLGFSAFADTCVWTGTVNQAWSSTQTGPWKDGKVPSTDGTDDVIFANDAYVEISLWETPNVKSMTFTGAEVYVNGGGPYSSGKTISIAGDSVIVSNDAKVTFYCKGFMARSALLDVSPGAVVDFKHLLGVAIGGLTGGGAITNTHWTSSNPPITNTLVKAAPAFSGTCGHVTLVLSPADSDSPNSRFVIGTETGLKLCDLMAGNSADNPFDYISMTKDVSRTAFRNITIAGDQTFLAPTNEYGKKVAIVDAQFLLSSGTMLSPDFLTEGATFTVQNDASLTLTGGSSTGTTYNASVATATVAFDGGTAKAPTFTTGHADATLVLGGGETTDAKWTLANDSSILVTGGVHRTAATTVQMKKGQYYYQTAGDVTLGYGVKCADSADNYSPIMNFVISGGTFTHLWNGSDWHRGIGLDLSGDAVANLKAGNHIRLASDGHSHTMRVRDNATLNMYASLGIGFGGSLCSTGTIDLVSGTMNMYKEIFQPGANKVTTFVLFNGGHLVYPALKGNISNSHDANHHIMINTNAAHVTLKADVPARTVTFATPFEANPENGAKVDGGLKKDGNGTLVLSSGLSFLGPIVVDDGALQLGGTLNLANDLTLNGAAIQLPDMAGDTALVTGSGNHLTYGDDSEIHLVGTAQGGTYTFGPSGAATSSLVPKDDSSHLFIRNDTYTTTLGTDFKVKVNGGVGTNNGLTTQPFFLFQRLDGNWNYTMSMLAYDQTDGFKPATLTDFDLAGANDLACVPTNYTLSASKTVYALHLASANNNKVVLTLKNNATLSVGDGIHPACIVFNNYDYFISAIKGTSGTVDFGTSRGVLVNCFHRCHYVGESVLIESTLAGQNGVVFTAPGEKRSCYELKGNNTYTGGTWISGSRVIPGSATAFGADRDVYVKGNAAWGGQISLEKPDFTLDYDLHLSGRGTLFPSSDNSTTVSEGALRATTNTTVSGTIEIVDDASIGVIATGDKTLTLSGVVSGSGQLEKIGDGALKLTADNSSFTGGFDIVKGIVQVSTAQALGSGAIVIETDGTLRFENTADIIVTNRITGSGTIVLAGSGKVTLANADGFVGAISFIDGTLCLDGDLALKTVRGTGAILGAGTLTLDIDEGALTEFKGAISGDISLVKRGGGTLVLTGSSSYSGSTTIAEGSISFDRDAALKELYADAVFHLDATDETTLTYDDNQVISEWRDADGRSISFVADSGSASPVYVPAGSDGMAGKGSVRFNAGMQYLVSSAKLSLQTLILIHRNKSGTRPSDMSSSWSCAGIFGYTANDLGIRFTSLTSYDSASAFSVGYSRFTVNGELAYTVTADAITIADATLKSSYGSYKMAIGDYWHDARYKRSYYGDIAEVLAFNRTLTEEEHALIVDNLMVKWGLAEDEGDDGESASSNILPTTTVLTIAEGASLDLAGENLAVGALAGAGTIENSASEEVTVTVTGSSSEAFTGAFGSGVSLKLGENATLTVPRWGGVTLPELAGSGRIAGGPVTVTGWIRPGGTNAIGTLTFAYAPIVDGVTLEIEGIGGEADQMVVEDDFDVAPLSLTVPNLKGLPRLGCAAILARTRSGTLLAEDVSNRGKNWCVKYENDSVRLRHRAAMMLLLK